MILTFSDKELKDAGYVDLGLPSGKLWASCNVGASKPYECGDFYAWGETEPKSDYSWENYKWRNGYINTTAKYCTVDNKTVLDNEDDVVYVATKGEAHMPTVEDVIELFNNTYNVWCIFSLGEGHETHTVSGKLFTSKTDSTKNIFIPAAGYQEGDCVYGASGELDIWSSSLSESYSKDAWYLYSNSGDVDEDTAYRFYGFSVRGVKDKQ